jgi:hypothetical protein
VAVLDELAAALVAWVLDELGSMPILDVAPRIMETLIEVISK